MRLNGNNCGPTPPRRRRQHANGHAEVERRSVVEALAGLAEQAGIGVQTVLGLGLELGVHCRLTARQHAVEPTQHHERQDHPPVLGLLVVAAQQIDDRPDEGGEGLAVYRC